MTANIDTPEGSERFQARVTKIIDPTTLKIKHDGKNQTVDLIGVRVPDSGQIHKKAVSLYELTNGSSSGDGRL